jgi:hypothetical protein
MTFKLMFLLTLSKPCFNYELLMNGWPHDCDLALRIFNHISAVVVI